MDKINVFDLALGGIITALSYFFKRELTKSDKMHEDHYKHSSDMTMHETDRERYLKKDDLASISRQLENHITRDDQRFDNLDKKIDAMGVDVKDILKIISNKS